MSDPTTPPAHLEVEAHTPDRNAILTLIGAVDGTTLERSR